MLIYDSHQIPSPSRSEFVLYYVVRNAPFETNNTRGYWSRITLFSPYETRVNPYLRAYLFKKYQVGTIHLVIETIIARMLIPCNFSVRAEFDFPKLEYFMDLEFNRVTRVQVRKANSILKRLLVLEEKDWKLHSQPGPYCQLVTEPFDVEAAPISPPMISDTTSQKPPINTKTMKIPNNANNPPAISSEIDSIITLLKNIDKRT
jgi:hypothetical protein